MFPGDPRQDLIGAKVKALDRENRWSAAVPHHQQTLDASTLGEEYDAVRNGILELATEIK